MVVDAVRTYLDAANGLTELSRKEAVAAAKALLRANGQASPVAEGDSLPRVGQSIQVLAGELVETSRANREAIAELVRGEVTRQLETMDVVSRGEYERLARRVAELERRLAARHAVERALVPRSTGGASPVGAPDTGGEEVPEEVRETERENAGAAEEGAETFEPTEPGPAEKGDPVARKAPARAKGKNARGKTSGKRTTKPAPKGRGTSKK